MSEPTSHVPDPVIEAPPERRDGELYGVIAEYDTPGELVEARRVACGVAGGRRAARW